MNYYFITGSSRGIGAAIANELLKDEYNYIIGFSRTNLIKHERFEHISFDLRDLDSVKNYRFINIFDAKSITLVNNSGMLGNIRHLGEIDNQSIIDVFNVNTIAPFLLMNNFIRDYKNFKGNKLIVNISSGAGRHPIESWSGYCASKSALDMLSEVANLEQKKLNRNPVKVLSIAPGIVDTQMQSEIRGVDKVDFGQVETFIKYKEENTLASTEVTAKKLVEILKNADKYAKTTMDIRELEI